MNTLTLTKRQHELLRMDTYCEYTEQNNPAPELASIRTYLNAGKRVPLTHLFIAHIKELADRDQDPNEQRVYKNLLRKIKTLTPA